MEPPSSAPATLPVPEVPDVPEVPEVPDVPAAQIQQHNITLTTSRLRLRPVVFSDLSALHSFRRDPLVMEHMSTPPDPEPVASLSATPSKLLGMMTPGTRFTMAVELLSPPPHSPPHTAIAFLGSGHRTAELFWLFGSDYWGKGYATEALQAWLECYWREFPRGLEGYSEEDAGYLTAAHYEENEASGRVMRKVGMREFMRVKHGEGLNMGEKERLAICYRIERPGRGEEGGQGEEVVGV